ncbi:MAG: CDP-diacylglycerol--glycerol-3-phosphate 3-phosphatidyltransferase [Candidatus Omnitrophica bacterium]|nr:CDP-diacylglycerol--glycerol-3-phosphate 3-phosphatidyltransferase [Candidatus Omnitrophota bacterium]
MTLPTKLTLARLLSTFVIMAFLFVPGWIAKAVALAGFLLASVTDWADGYLARRWRQTTPLGALLDPIADKVLVLGMFLAFVQLRLIPAWMVLIIALREFLITGVRLFAASRNVVLPAAKEGKHKTVSQIVAILVILLILLVQEWLGRSAISVRAIAMMQGIVLGCLWVAMVLTVISGASFFWRHRSILREAMSR